MSGMTTQGERSPELPKKKDLDEFIVAVRTHADRLGRPANVYETFAVALRDYEGKRTERDDVMQRIRLLFEGYPALIKGFSRLLPHAGEYILEAGSRAKL
ncbi:hypothetical protein Hypma_003448 [Hypsizygus marmoreus]|uniref:Uncharacterized protein n=1 Tax=Hypsizygus marmoreus TaxID=39966 RepID=A0A369J211_HYPMA|nr:hypothetical protein Hypma_003448 [Hypsizygus marmoreus]